MPRVPFVGRLHLYLPPFRARRSSSSASASVSPSSPSPPHPHTTESERLYYKFKQEEEQRSHQLAAQKKKPWFLQEANTFLASPLPVWSRNSQEYVALGVSLFVLIIEHIIRVITIALPTPIIRWFYLKSRLLFNAFSPASHTTKSSTRKEKSIVAQIREAGDFVELCEIWGYEAEEHIVQTGDGYLLGLHRVRRKGASERRGRERSRARGGKMLSEDLGKKVVYLHHGLLMNSEVWVCLTQKERCLPFVLVDAGYDVWLGNNRGNKYSKKCIHHSSSSIKFWDFSMDQFAMHDIPDSINYILETTKSRSLSYIGFSQGTAQAFATLSIHPTLNEKVDVFIALAPAMSPPGLHNPVVDAFIKASPNILFLLFGRKSILSSATFWQSILYPPIFVRLIDAALGFLFNWSAANIGLNQKIAAYSHLYSFTSTKSVVHWFQIIRNKSFQMYDDEPASVFGANNFYKVAKFPTRNISTPIVLVWGGSDSLVDIRVMLRELPRHTVAKEVPHYEHLDMLWGEDVDRQVFPTVLAALEQYSASEEGEDAKMGELSYYAREMSRSPNPVPRLMVSREGGLYSDADDERATDMSDIDGPALLKPNGVNHHHHSSSENGITPKTRPTNPRTNSSVSNTSSTSTTTPSSSSFKDFLLTSTIKKYIPSLPYPSSSSRRSVWISSTASDSTVTSTHSVIGPEGIRIPSLRAGVVGPAVVTDGEAERLEREVAEEQERMRRREGMGRGRMRWRVGEPVVEGGC